jgi:hypothetical protein
MGVETYGCRPGGCNVYNIRCGSCGDRYDLKPPLCPACLERSLMPEGPYRTPAALPAPPESPLEEMCAQVTLYSKIRDRDQQIERLEAQREDLRHLQKRTFQTSMAMLVVVFILLIEARLHGH